MISLPPRFTVVLGLFVAGEVLAAAAAEPGAALERHWTLDTATGPELHLRGPATTVRGVRGNALLLEGRSLVELHDSAALNPGPAGFTVTLWVAPFAPGGEQQMIAAKNRYSLGERQWGVMIDRDGKFRLYIDQSGWKTAAATTTPRPGQWHHVGVVLRAGEAELWIDGRREGTLPLAKPIRATAALLTLGGVNDNGALRQTFHGALDDVRFFARPLSAAEMGSLFTPVTATLAVPARPPPASDPGWDVHAPLAATPLWDEKVPLPKSADLPILAGVEFHVIKKHEPETDGYPWLHGIGLGWHKGKLYASFGHNRGAENTASEEARGRVSADGGKTWGDVYTIDIGTEAPDLAVSHGVFLSRGGTLWAFHGAFFGKMDRIHTRAYTLDERTGRWQPKGIVVEGGFWALNQPVKMADGNWIMAGACVGTFSEKSLNPPAVAISRGNDFSHWELVRIRTAPGLGMWGESAVIVDGARVLNIARFGEKAQALLAVSEDSGRTWTPSAPSNLPMATSKPAAGVLSNGQRYLVCTTTADSGKRRSPLTIAVSRPGESVFSKVIVIRHAVFPEGPGESGPAAALSYPCAVEHEGKLYVGYSNSAGRRGNHNSAELAIIPLASLRVE